MKLTEEQLKRACDLNKQGISWNELANQYNVTREMLRTACRRSPFYNQCDKQIDVRACLLKAIENEVELKALASKLNTSERVLNAYIDDLKEEGYTILSEDGKAALVSLPINTNNTYIKSWNGDRIIRFGLMGDTQMNSKYTQITHLHNFYDICQREGITTIYNTGDIDEGEQMRPGHQYECYKQGSDEHVDEIVKNYPKRKGITTEFITGNHDHSLIKRCGQDIGIAIARQRDDMKYLGQSSALIHLTPNCTMELRHPIDGTAYAISYKMQKMIEAMTGGEKPNILAVGHYHKAEYLPYRNVHSIQTACFQAQTSWMRGKGIAAMMGGWIIEAHVDDEGTITRFKPEYIQNYIPIKDDYLNWR